LIFLTSLTFVIPFYVGSGSVAFQFRWNKKAPVPAFPFRFRGSGSTTLRTGKFFPIEVEPTALAEVKTKNMGTKFFYELREDTVTSGIAG
jgi:hypothetical protein